MALKLTNNASTLLATSITTVATSLQISDATNFPALAAGDWFPLTLVDNANNIEIMRCTARAGNVLTVVRAQEGTIARAFTANVTRVDIRLTAGALMDGISNADNLTSGTVGDAVLPSRLRATQMVVADCNAITESASYTTNAATLNVPIAGGFGYLEVDVLNSTTQLQEWFDYNTDAHYIRRSVGGVFTAWRRISDAPEVPIGNIMDTARTTEPAGWLFCFGQAVLRTTYPDLDTAIYCGDADNATALIGYRTTTVDPAGARSTTGAYIVLPDLRDRVVAGRGNMGGAPANRLTGQPGGLDGDGLGRVGGAETVALAEANLAAHTHPAGTLAAGADGAHEHFAFRNVAASGNNLDSAAKYAATGRGDAGDWNYTMGGTASVADVGRTSLSSTHTHPMSGSTGSIGSGTAHNNVQPTLVLNKIIRAF